MSQQNRLQMVYGLQGSVSTCHLDKPRVKSDDLLKVRRLTAKTEFCTSEPGCALRANIRRTKTIARPPSAEDDQ